MLCITYKKCKTILDKYPKKLYVSIPAAVDKLETIKKNRYLQWAFDCLFVQVNLRLKMYSLAALAVKGYVVIFTSSLG